MIFFLNHFCVYTAVFHSILKCIVIYIFQNAPQMTSVSVNQNALSRKSGNQLQLALGKDVYKRQ